MRKLKFKSRILFSLFAVLTFAAMFVFTAFATGDPTVEPQTAEPTQIVTEAPKTEPPKTEPPQTEAPQTVEPTHHYETEYTEADPKKKEELPSVKKSEVETATTVKLPDVEVSDTTLLYGVLAWLCVAVGIAAVVGVLVSKRTRAKQPK